MEKLFYLLQSDKQFKRHVQLLKFLSTCSTPLTTETLATELSCTKPTLLHDIQLLNERLPDDIEISKQSRDGIKLIHQGNYFVDSYITQMAKKTLPYSIIDAIFHNKIYSFTRAQDEFFVSRTVLRKVLNHMNTILKPFKISISTIDLNFIGEESNIRFFLFVFYSDFRELFIVRSEQDIHADSYADLLISARSKNLPRLHFSYFRATIWIMIIKQRLTCKQNIKICDALKREVGSLSSYHAFSDIFHQSLGKVFGFHHLSQQEAIFGYIVSLHCVSYSDACTLDNNEPFVYRRETSPKVLQEVKEFLSPFLGNQINEYQKWERLVAYLVNSRLLSMISPLYTAVSHPLQSFVKNTDTFVYNEWIQHIESHPTNHLFSMTFKQDVATTLTLLYSTIMEDLPAHTPMRVLFSFQGEAGYDEFLVKTVKLLLKKDMKADYSFEKSITKEMIIKLQSDIVICNYDLPYIENSPCPIIRLSYIPNAMEWTTLKNKLYDMHMNHRIKPKS